MRCYVFLSDESLLTWRPYNRLKGSRLTGLTCSKTPGFWMVEHQLVSACQPAIRPGCARCRALEISHDEGNGGRFMKMLFQK